MIIISSRCNQETKTFLLALFFNTNCDTTCNLRLFMSCRMSESAKKKVVLCFCPAFAGKSENKIFLLLKVDFGTCTEIRLWALSCAEG